MSMVYYSLQSQVTVHHSRQHCNPKPPQEADGLQLGNFLPRTLSEILLKTVVQISLKTPFCLCAEAQENLTEMVCETSVQEKIATIAYLILFSKSERSKLHMTELLPGLKINFDVKIKPQNLIYHTSYILEQNLMDQNR